jgi:hypothetical protein
VTLPGLGLAAAHIHALPLARGFPRQRLAVGAELAVGMQPQVAASASLPSVFTPAASTLSLLLVRLAA